MLTDVQIRKSKPTDKGYRLTDGGGLHLFVSPNGSKLWRMRYEFGGKEKLLSFGPYPSLSLADARDERESVRKILRTGQDPAFERKKERRRAVADSLVTFEAVARDWHGQNAHLWSDRHSGDVLRSMERDVFPILGSYPIREIGVPEVLDLLRTIEKRDAKETARRLRQRMSAVFVFAIATSRGETDPAGVVKGAMAPLLKGRQPAITDLELARQILRDVDATPGYPVTKLAIRILALTAVRPGTLVTTPWSEIDAIDPDDPVWRISAERMKLRKQSKDDEARDHLVPLSRQAVEAFSILATMRGRMPLVFQNARHRHRPMSENAMGYMLNRAGYHHRHVPHGFRTTFSTIMNERSSADRAVIDFMLAHSPKDKVEAAYNRASYLARRKALSQEWADLLMVEQMPAQELVDSVRRTGIIGRSPLNFPA